MLTVMGRLIIWLFLLGDFSNSISWSQVYLSDWMLFNEDRLKKNTKHHNSL